MHIRWRSPRVRNLALGKPYTIGAQWPDALFSQTERQQYPDSGQLTDGQTGALNVKDPGWVGLLRQYGRSIVIDLGEIQDVRAVELRFLQNLRAGIQFPYTVRFYASADGASWHPVGSCGDQAGWYTEAPQIQVFSTEMHGNAQFIRIQFTAKVYAFMDECYVRGYPAPDRDADPLPGTGLTELMGRNYLVDPDSSDARGFFELRHVPFASSDKGGSRSIAPISREVAPPAREIGAGAEYLTARHPASGGVNHMQLVYTGSGDSLGTWGADDFQPMIAQIAEDGQPVRWLFDATLFGPYGKMPTSAAAWSAWLRDLFLPDVNVNALNQTVGQLKQQFADADFAESVVLTLPATLAAPSDFGSIAPGADSLNMNPADVGPDTAVVNKLAALRWIMQEMLQRWREANPIHLRLAGFYWRPESVNASDPYDPWLIGQVADAVHAEGLLFYWIPFYGSVGVTVARQLGFDAVLIQPNVSFNWNLDAPQRLRSVSDMARYYHMGVEIELHWDITNKNNPAHVETALSRYDDYFTAGQQYGFGGRVTKAYYLNSKSLVQCSRSADQLSRQAYTDTLTFVRDEWTRKNS